MTFLLKVYLGEIVVVKYVIATFCPLVGSALILGLIELCAIIVYACYVKGLRAKDWTLWLDVGIELHQKWQIFDMFYNLDEDCYGNGHMVYKTWK